MKKKLDLDVTIHNYNPMRQKTLRIDASFEDIPEKFPKILAHWMP